jgi:hypothetical protein
MTKQPDEFDAVRTVVETLSSFEQKRQEQIIRWAQERLGILVGPAIYSASGAETPAGGQAIATAASHPTAPVRPAVDIKTFVESKKPKNDVQFVTTVAYYYRFEAPAEQRKDEIDKDDLINACRLASWKRPPNPDATVRNAHTLGYLEKGTTKGKFVINSVGENLVAMVLPDSSSSGAVSGRRRRLRKPNGRARGATSKKPTTAKARKSVKTRTGR